MCECCSRNVLKSLRCIDEDLFALEEKKSKLLSRKLRFARMMNQLCQPCKGDLQACVDRKYQPPCFLPQNQTIFDYSSPQCYVSERKIENMKRCFSAFDSEKLTLITEKMKLVYILEDCNQSYISCPDPAMKDVIMKKMEQKMQCMKLVDLRLCEFEDRRARCIANNFHRFDDPCIKYGPCDNPCPCPAPPPFYAPPGSGCSNCLPRVSPRCGFSNHNNHLGRRSNHSLAAELRPFLGQTGNEPDAQESSIFCGVPGGKGGKYVSTERVVSAFDAEPNYSKRKRQTRKERTKNFKSVRKVKIQAQSYDTESTDAEQKDCGLSSDRDSAATMMFQKRVDNLEEFLGHHRQDVECPSSTTYGANSDLELSKEGLDFLFQHLESVAIGDKEDKSSRLPYRTCGPSLPVRKEILSAANKRSTLRHISPLSVTMVIMDQLERMVRATTLRCLLTDSMLRIKNPTFFKITTMVSPESRDLWQRVFIHLLRVSTSESMQIETLADLFAPILIHPQSRMFIQAASLISKLLHDELDEGVHRGTNTISSFQDLRNESPSLSPKFGLSTGNGHEMGRSGERAEACSSPQQQQKQQQQKQPQKEQQQHQSSPVLRENLKKQEMKVKPIISRKVSTTSNIASHTLLEDPPAAEDPPLNSNRLQGGDGPGGRPSEVPYHSSHGDGDEMGKTPYHGEKKAEDHHGSEELGETGKDGVATEVCTDEGELDHEDAGRSEDFEDDSIHSTGSFQMTTGTLSLTQTAAYQKLLTESLGSPLRLSDSGSEDDIESNMRLIAGGNRTHRTDDKHLKSPATAALRTTDNTNIESRQARS